MIDLLNDLELPTSVLTNSSIYDHCPEVIDAFRERGDEILAHGRTNSERQVRINVPMGIIYNASFCQRLTFRKAGLRESTLESTKTYNTGVRNTQCFLPSPQWVIDDLGRWSKLAIP